MSAVLKGYMYVYYIIPYSPTYWNVRQHIKTSSTPISCRQYLRWWNWIFSGHVREGESIKCNAIRIQYYTHWLSLYMYQQQCPCPIGAQPLFVGRHNTRIQHSQTHTHVEYVCVFIRCACMCCAVFRKLSCSPPSMRGRSNTQSEYRKQRGHSRASAANKFVRIINNRLNWNLHSRLWVCGKGGGDERDTNFNASCVDFGKWTLN